MAAVFAEADRRDPAHQRTWIALADGNKDQIARIDAQAAARGITVTIVVDLIHVTEHLWDAAWCLFPKASPDAGAWVRARTAQILDGGPAGAAAVAAALRTAAARLGRTRRATAEKTAGYLEAKAPYLDYPAGPGAGWPIATGVIEGACRHLVKDRMDITGARWGVRDRRSHPQAPRPARQRRLRRLLGRGTCSANTNATTPASYALAA